MWVVDRVSGRLLDANAAALRRYGYTREEFLALGVQDLRVPDEHAALNEELRTLAAGTTAPSASRGLRDAKVWHRRRDGSRFAVHAPSDDIVWHGRSARLVLASDRTEQLALQQAVHDAYDRVADGIVTFDKERRYVHVNPRAAELLGFAEASHLIGRRIWEAFPDRVGSTFHACFERAMAGETVVLDDDYYAPTHRWFESRLYPSDQGLTVFFTDMTARHNAAADVLARKHDFRLLVEQIPAVVYRAEDVPPFKTLWVSPQIEQLGYTVEQWTDVPEIWAACLHPDDRETAQTALYEGLAAHGQAEIEYRLQRADGRYVHVQDIARRVDPGDGRPVFIQGVMLDITQRHQAERALAASRQSLSDLARRLLSAEKDTTQRLARDLHDGLGQTLAIARLNHDALQALLADEGTQREAAGRVATGLSTAVQQVRQLLLDLRPPLLNEQGLAAALDNEVRALGRGAQQPVITLQVSAAATRCKWPSEVEYGAFMAAREALSNAVRHAQARRVDVRLSGGPRWLTLRIVDDGIGIPAGDLAGKPGRLGIVGLHERALAMGAHVQVERGKRRGTRVSLSWPAA
jgi:PAS domain S-box-containing protein